MTDTSEPSRVVTSSSAPPNATMPSAAPTGTEGATASADPAPKKRVGLPPGKMTQAHREALAAGRRRGQIVRNYLKAIATKPQRGRPITKDGLRRKIADADRKLKDETDPLRKLDLVQLRIDAQRKLDEFDAPVDLARLEKEFVREAKGYGEAKGISAEAWIELGVPRDVLKKAKIVD